MQHYRIHMKNKCNNFINYKNKVLNFFFEKKFSKIKQNLVSGYAYDLREVSLNFNNITLEVSIIYSSNFSFFFLKKKFFFIIL